MAGNTFAQKIFWTERDNNRIMIGNLAPSGAITGAGVFLGGLTGPEDISLDISDERIFYTDSYGENIISASIYDGVTFSTVITTGGMVNITDFAYSSSNNLYITIGQEADGVYSVPHDNNDGGNDVLLPVNGNGSETFIGIAVSDLTDQLFMINPADNAIYRTDLSGNLTTAFGPYTGLQHIAVDRINSRIYYTTFDGTSSNIYSSDLNGGTNTAIKNAGPGEILSIQVYPQFNKIYYVQNDFIKVINMNGTDVTSLDLNGTGIHDIAVWYDVEAPTFNALAPADNNTAVNPSTTQLTMTFNEPVSITPEIVSGAAHQIEIFQNGTSLVTIPKSSPLISITGNTVTIDVTGNLLQAHNYHVIVGNQVFEDLTGNDFVGISFSTGWNFSTQCVSLNAGVASGDQTVCPGGDPTILSGGTPSGGDGIFGYQWESSTTSATGGFTDIATATNVNFDPPANLSVTTYYRVRVSSANCTAAQSNPVTVTVTTPPAITSPPTNAEACPGGSATFQITVTGSSFTYQWQADDGTGFTDIIDGSVYSGTATNLLSVTNVTGLDGFQYRCVIKYDVCALNSNPATLTINAPPVANDQAPPAVCENPPGSGSATFDLTTLHSAITGGQANRSISWYSDNGLTTPVSVPSGASINNGTIYFATVKNDITGCFSTNAAKATFAITPAPTASALPGAPVICSGTGTGITLSGATSYSWTVSANPAVTGASAGSGTSINQTLSNTSSSQQQIDYVVTPVAGGCTGQPFTTTVSVNPSPAVSASPPAPVICSGASTGVTLSGATSYSWTISANPNITGSSAGSGATINQLLTNGSSTPQSIDYVITPVASGCTGSPLTLQVTVNASPTAIATPSAPVICSGAGTGVSLSGAGSYSWTVSSNPNITGASAGSGAAINQVLTNLTSIEQQINYSITAVSGGCTGQPSVLQVRVTPGPAAVATPSAPVICSGTTTGISLSGADSYAWTVSPSPNITGASAGSGPTINQTLTNTSSTQQQINYTITPTTAGCTGQPLILQVNVHTVPVATAAPPSPAICSGTGVGVTLNGATSYSWTISSNPGIAGASAGSGSSINQVLTNTSSSQQQINYNIIPSANGCTGTPLVLPVSVNVALTSFNVSGGGTTCQNGPGVIVGLSDTQAGISYELLLGGQPTGITAVAGGGAFNFPAVSAAGNYTIRAANSQNCKSMMNGSATVIVNTSPTGTGTVSGLGSVCIGAVERYTVSGIVNASSYEWSYPSGIKFNSQAGPSISLLMESGTGGTISVRSFNQCGAGVSADFTVAIFPAPEFELVLPAEISALATAVFGYTSRSEIISSTWDFGDNSAAGSGQQVTHIFGSEGTYTLTVDALNSTGCSTKKTDTLVVVPANGDSGNGVDPGSPSSAFSDFSIKNVITANGDSKNAFLFIQDIQSFPGSQVILIDRWGKEVFSAHGYANDWDLKKNGEYIPAGNYVCIVKMAETGEVFKRAVTVIKGR